MTEIEMTSIVVKLEALTNKINSTRDNVNFDFIELVNQKTRETKNSHPGI